MDHLKMTAGKLGIDKQRLEFHLGYYEMQTFDYRTLQFPDRYSAILVGPMPHSSAGKHDSSSAICEMEKNQDLYPRVIRMMAGTELKITQSSFKAALSRLQSEGCI